MKHLILTLLTVSFLGTFVSSGAYALGVDFDSIPKLKPYETPTLDSFKSTAKNVKYEEPSGDKLVGYEFWLPQQWTDNVLKTAENSVEGKTDIGSSIFSMLARYVSDPKNLTRSYVSVEGENLTYEIKAKHWFVSQILSKGLTLTAMTERSDKEVEGLYVEMIKDTSYVVRARVFINGNKIIVVRYYLPQDNYELEKSQQAKVIESFKLLNPTNENIEKQEVFGFLDQSYFNYPVSWRLKEKPILTIERMSALLFQETMQREDLVLEGHVRINVISRLLNTTLAQEVKGFKENLKIPDYKLGKFIENVDFKKDPSINISKTQFYQLVPDDPVNKRQYELMVSILQSKDYHYIVSMITPSRDLDFYGWAKNLEAGKIIVESMRRNKDAVVIDSNDPYYDYLKEVQ